MPGLPQHATSAPSNHSQRKRRKTSGTPGIPPPHVGAYAAKSVDIAWRQRIRQPPSSSTDPLAATYNQKFFGLDDPCQRPAVCEYFRDNLPLVTVYLNLSDMHLSSAGPLPEWKASLPTHATLLRTPFGRPARDKSMTQVASFDTVAFNVLKSGYLDIASFTALCECDSTIMHMAKLLPILADYDFTWLRNYDSDWNSYESVPPKREMAFLALLFHYDLHLSAVVRFLGEKFTGSYRDVDDICAQLAPHVEPHLIAEFRRVMTMGGPALFNAETSRANTLLYWREGNDRSINQHESLVRKNMTKEMKNSFAFPLPSWIARFLKHIHLTPQCILLQKDKYRLIFNARQRHTPDAVSLNMMTSTHLGHEMECAYGTVYRDIFIRLYNLRISYPDDDLVLHANDVASCFRQLKHHPDVVAAFCYILFEHLWVPVGLTFGSDFSPQTWEPCRRVLEQLAEGLFDDDSLRDKHREHLDKILWSDSLASKKFKDFVPAFRDSKNPGVTDDDGRPRNTPHSYFVDDGIYADVYDVERIERALAASIEAIFIILGQSDTDRRKDPVSFDKMCDLVVSHFTKILGLQFNLRKMTVGPPPEFIAETLRHLKKFHRGRRQFEVKEMSELLGRLQHIANTSIWLNHMLSHLYTSLASALRVNKAYLIHTRKAFREAVDTAQSSSASPQHRSFAQSSAARQVHACRQRAFFNKTALEELALIYSALSNDCIPKFSPLAYLIPRDPSGKACGDSCLYAAGGWSVDMRFWWYIKWPDEIVNHTLKYITSNPDKGKLISINVLEYATVLINYCAAILYFKHDNPSADPHPTVHIDADNTTAVSWATSGCKRGLAMGRALGRLQCALMLRNTLGLTSDYINTKDNWIADEISRIKRESDSLESFCSLIKRFPQLNGCRRYHPSAALISAITDALLTQKLHDPVALSQQLLNNLGSFTTCASASN